MTDPHAPDGMDVIIRVVEFYSVIIIEVKVISRSADWMGFSLSKCLMSRRLADPVDSLWMSPISCAF